MNRVAIFPWGDPIEKFLEPIGLTLQDFAERMTGGWLFGYVEALRSAGIEAVVVVASSSVSRAERLVHAGTGAPIRVVPVPPRAPGRPSNRESLRAWARTPLPGFARALRDEGCDAILVQEYEYARFDALVLLGSALRLPVFAAFQGGDWTASPLEARVRPWSLKACRGLIVPSRRERERLASVYGVPAGKIVDIPNPLDTAAWRPADRAESRRALNVREDEVLFVTHGRVDIARKGLDVLLAAWRRVAAARPTARLLMIGSGQDEAAFQAMIDADPPPRLERLASYVTDRQAVRARLSAADAYVAASRLEGLPVAPLEAMACGLPVVATDIHGLSDIFEAGEAHGGLVIPPGDTDALAAAMLRLHDEPALRRRLAEAARSRVESRFAPEQVGAALKAFMTPFPLDGGRVGDGGARATLRQKAQEAVPPQVRSPRPAAGLSPQPALPLREEGEGFTLDVAICTWNRADDLDRVLTALAAQTVQADVGWRVLVVDNASTDHTAAVVERHAASGALPGLRRVHEPEQGLTPARRRAVLETSADWIAFVDDDNLLEPGWIAAVAAEARARPEAGGIGGRVVLDWVAPPPPYLKEFGWCFAEQDHGPEPRAVDNLAGAGMVLNRRALVESGWLDRPLLADRIGARLVSGGDAEIAQRVRATGRELRYVPGAVLRHRIPPGRMTRDYLFRIAAGLGASEAQVATLAWRDDPAGWRRQMRASLKRRAGWAMTRLRAALVRRAGFTAALAWSAYAWGLYQASSRPLGRA
ncbi:MAG TPA: glycosyltransferase [Caulobacteraceae bacterium]|nr:glycosyltransferase [Caulobacteraceae bacterium]